LDTLVADDRRLKADDRSPVFQLGSKENLPSFWVEPASTGAYNQKAFIPEKTPQEVTRR